MASSFSSLSCKLKPSAQPSSFSLSSSVSFLFPSLPFPAWKSQPEAPAGHRQGEKAAMRWCFAGYLLAPKNRALEGGVREWRQRHSWCDWEIGHIKQMRHPIEQIGTRIEENERQVGEGSDKHGAGKAIKNLEGGLELEV